jgi:hypothetical protein
MVQQCRLKSSIFSELGVGSLPRFLIGLVELREKGTNFRGIFLPPYQVLPSLMNYSSVPEIFWLIGIAIGLTASHAGFKDFSDHNTENLILRHFHCEFSLLLLHPWARLLRLYAHTQRRWPAASCHGKLDRRRAM